MWFGVYPQKVLAEMMLFDREKEVRRGGERKKGEKAE